MDMARDLSGIGRVLKGLFKNKGRIQWAVNLF